MAAEAIDALEARLKAAWAAKDIDTVMSFYPEDCHFIYSDVPGVLAGKGSVRDKLQKEMERTENLDLNVIDRVVGENIVSEVGTFCCKLKGEDKVEHARYAVTFVKRGGKWMTKFDVNIL